MLQCQSHQLATRRLATAIIWLRQKWIKSHHTLVCFSNAKLIFLCCKMSGILQVYSCQKKVGFKKHRVFTMGVSLVIKTWNKTWHKPNWFFTVPVLFDGRSLSESAHPGWTWQTGVDVIKLCFTITDIVTK